MTVTAIEEVLLSLYIQSLNSRYRIIWGSSIEQDKRKRDRVIRELLQKGYIRYASDKENETFTVTEKILEFRKFVTPYDLKAKWLERRTNSDYYRAGMLASPQVAASLFGDAIIEMKDDPSLLWYAGRRKDMINMEWGEPMSYFDAMTALRNADHDTTLAVSSKELEAFAVKTFEEERFQQLYNNNLEWGLKTLLIAGENDAIPTHLQYSTGWPGCLNQTTMTPDKWESNLINSIEQLRKSIEERTAALLTLTQIDRNIKSFGGWDKFKKAYETRLKEEFEKTPEPKPPEA